MMDMIAPHAAIGDVEFIIMNRYMRSGRGSVRHDHADVIHVGGLIRKREVPPNHGGKIETPPSLLLKIRGLIYAL